MVNKEHLLQHITKWHSSFTNFHIKFISLLMAKLTEFSSSKTTRKGSTSWGSGLVLFTLAVLALALLIVQLDSFETVAYPMHELGESIFIAATQNAGSLSGLEKIGSGQLIGPEDIIYEPNSGVVYTGCHDGWIKRFPLNDSSAIENWVRTGGVPLGIAIDESGVVFVADAYKGLLKVKPDGQVEVLTTEAEGVPFAMPDGVVVAKNGMLYFTDASYKYNYPNALYGLLEGRPRGRLLSYDPSTKETKVLLRDLYFANGIELSPDQDFLIVCETFMRRCSRYYLNGEKKGSTDVFVNKLPGLPDNIRYDGNGRYWVAIPWDNSIYFQYTQRYPFIRKIFAFTLKRLRKMPDINKFGGVIALDLDGKPIGAYYDDTWRMTTSGVKIGDSLYLGSIVTKYILRLNLTQHPLIASTS